MFFVHLVGIDTKKEIILWYGDVDQARAALGVYFMPTKGSGYTVGCDVIYDGRSYVATGHDMRIGKPVIIKR